MAGRGGCGMSARRRAWWLWLLAVLVAALFTRLGFWQLARMHEKQAMIAAAERVLAARQAKPLALAERVGGYDWSAGQGHFLALPPILLDNQVHAERVGVRAWCVFQPDAGVPLLVDLGWYGYRDDRDLPVIGCPQPLEREIGGLLTAPPSPGLAIGPPLLQDRGRWIATRMELPAIAAALRLPLALAPRVLRLDPATPLGGTRDLVVLPNTMPPERHQAYAVQWFGLATAVLVIAVVLTLRASRSRDPDA